jgi:hypothetical protein
VETDPMLERFDPGSKTKRIAINYQKLVDYLHREGVIDANDRVQSVKAATLLEKDLERVQRASWVLKQSGVARTIGMNEFDSEASRDEHQAMLRLENGEDQTYEVVEAGHNFVLADRCDSLGELLIMFLDWYV